MWLNLGFLCLLHKSEICALRIGDIRCRKDGLPSELLVRQSKTDAAGIGEKVPIPEDTGLFFNFRKRLAEYIVELKTLGWVEDSALIPVYDVHKKSMVDRSFKKDGLAARLRKLLGWELAKD